MTQTLTNNIFSTDKTVIEHIKSESSKFEIISQIKDYERIIKKIKKLDIRLSSFEFIINEKRFNIKQLTELLNNYNFLIKNNDK